MRNYEKNIGCTKETTSVYNVIKKSFCMIMATVLTVSLAAVPVFASNLIYEQNFEGNDLPSEVSNVESETNGNRYWAVAKGNWTGKSGTLAFDAVSDGKIRVSFDYKQATASSTARAQYVVLEGDEGAANNKNRIAVLSDRGPILGAFTNDERTRVLVDNPDVNKWYTIECDIDLSGFYDNGTEKHSIVSRVKERGATVWAKAVEADLQRTATDFLGWAQESTSFHTLRIIGNSGGNIDNIKIERIYDPPKSDVSRIKIKDFRGTVVEDLESVNPAIDTIEIDFGTDMDTTTMTKENVCLKKSDGTIVSETPIYNGGKVTLNINNCLEPETDYDLFIAKEVQNLAEVTVGEENIIHNIKTNKGALRAFFGTATETEDEITVPITYTNSTKTGATPCFAVAYYGENDKLLSLETKNGAAISALTKSKTETFVYEKKTVEDAKSWKIMVTDGAETRKPIGVSLTSEDTEKTEMIFGDTDLSVTIGDGAVAGTVKISGTGAVGNDLLNIAVFPGKNASGKFNIGELPVGNDVFDENSNPKEGAVAFAGDCRADGNGVFAKEFQIAKTGWYTVYVTSGASGEYVCIPEFAFVDKEAYADIIGKLNDEAAKLGGEASENEVKTEFARLISSNLFLLGLESELTSNADIGAVSNILCETVKKTPLVAENKEDNTEIWNKCVYTSMLNSKSVTDISDKIADIIKNDSLYEYYKKHISEKEHREYLTEKMSGKNIKSLDELEKYYRGALVLTVVKYPDGPGNIRDIFKVSTDVTGIQSSDVTAKIDVYQKLSGSYNSVEDMVKRYNELKRTTQQGSSGGSGGSGGGGGSSSGKTTPTINIPNPTAKPTEKEVVNMPFDDLDTVMWAYEAIATLADKGIINGKTETKFAPRENITREEFVKIIMEAFGYKANKTKNIFSDVKESDWFVEYVNGAYEKGIISGMGDDCFGTGQNITRRDMAVILYNALQTKNIDLKYTEITFTDKDSIGDYAVNAVGALAEAGIISGYDDGTFGPLNTATRAEAVQMIFGVIKLLK